MRFSICVSQVNLRYTRTQSPLNNATYKRQANQYTSPVETKVVIEEREEIMSGIAEFTTVVVLVAIVLAPRLIDLYLSAKEESTPA